MGAVMGMRKDNKLCERAQAYKKINERRQVNRKSCGLKRVHIGMVSEMLARTATGHMTTEENLPHICISNPAYLNLVFSYVFHI